MALRKCGECGRQVSHTASSCPSCGASRATLDAGFEAEDMLNWMKGCVSLVVISVFLLVLLVFLGGVGCTGLLGILVGH